MRVKQRKSKILKRNMMRITRKKRNFRNYQARRQRYNQYLLSTASDPNNRNPLGMMKKRWSAAKYGTRTARPVKIIERALTNYANKWRRGRAARQISALGYAVPRLGLGFFRR